MADIMTLKKFETLSPFEIKDELISLAKKTSRTTQSAFLNAGRGNPNWIATTPREGFFLLGQFAITESKRVMEHPAGVGGMPAAQGIANRLAGYLSRHQEMPGASFLAAIVPFAVKLFGFQPDAFVHELVDSIIGDNYPVPDRMLVHNERITHEYLMWAMCGNPHPKGKFDLYAVEGGTAAMCYIFKSLKANRLLKPGDTIALATPIFTPYIEMTHLEDYALNVVNIEAKRDQLFQFTDAELKKLENPT
ncbi:MAG: bifunctional aspartate transaminase/aspartate 4-decarboxylase, partial [Candidatus Rokuibacteriota bacterium]